MAAVFLNPKLQPQMRLIVKMETKLFVGNLSGTTTEDDLSALFARAGSVASVELISLQSPAVAKRFAFVDMGSRQDAEQAVRLLNGSNLHGRSLKVDIARPREARPAGGGWYTDSPPPGRRRQSPSRRK
jgi:RNA recognition motif-containing protein